jgi:glycosyltransferase involved in cell wall biosynthesis
MRLLWFNLATDTDHPTLGFAPRWIGALARRVEYIHVITMRAGRAEIPPNVRVHSIGKEKGYSESRRVAEFYRYLLRVLREDNIDVCFSHMMPLFTVLGGPALKAKSIPIVTWYAHPRLTAIVKMAHYLSDYMVASIPTAYPYKRDKLIPVGQGIDTHLFSPNGGILREDPPLILCVGRLSPVKNHATLLRAAWLLRQRQGQSFRVVILGDCAAPPDERYLRALRTEINELELAGIVFLEPAVPMIHLPAWYRRCTVHVNLTPLGFGDKVAWEAMSCGNPCLVANEGFCDTLGKYTQRLLFRYGDAQDLASKLEALLALSASKLDEVGHYLRQQVVQRHSLEHLAGNLMTVFHTLRRDDQARA